MAEVSAVQTSNSDPLTAASAEPVVAPGSQTSRPARLPARRPARSTGIPERSALFERAIDLALQGFAVFPLSPGTKKPLIKDWENQASTDPEQVACWWTAHPHANIAIACGPSNLLVIDLDAAKKPGGPRHGQHVLSALAAGREIPATFTVASARGGRHLYFRQPDGAALRNTTGSGTTGLGPLIDTRGHGGFIVAPGSTFNGRTYRIEREAPVAPLPSWILNDLSTRQTAATRASAPPAARMPVTDRRRRAYGNAALRRSVNTVATAQQGTRNDTLNREAFRLGRLVGGQVLDLNDAMTELRRAARKAGLPPGEAENTITSGLNVGISHPRSIPDPAPEPQTANPTTEEQMATAIRQHETAQEPEVRVQTAPATAATTRAEAAPAAPPQTTADEEPAATPQTDSNDIWAGVRASIERARQALPDWSELRTIDDLKPAIDEAFRYLAQTPISSVIPGRGDDAAAPESAATTSDYSVVIEKLDKQGSADHPADDLDEHLAAVDAAYDNARSARIPDNRPEWARIDAIHSAIHNLWDTIKAAAGTSWAELSADARVHGLLTTLATRAVRAIAALTNAAAGHLEQHATQQPPDIEAAQPGLRQAYINARSQIRAGAASHEWQRITALWGTINTLARQTSDPGIRAVVARSADAISDHADALARRTSQIGHADVTLSLKTLATAAERHAASLRASEPSLTPHIGPTQPAAAVSPARAPDRADRTRQGPEAQALQARARQVAQHAQARLTQAPMNAAPVLRHAHGITSPHSQGATPSAVQPNASKTYPNIRVG